MKNRAKRYLLFVMSFFFCFFFSTVKAESVRRQIDINSEWKFKKGPKSFEEAMVAFKNSKSRKIDLPHTWNTDVFQGKGFYKGLGWYAKKLKIDRSMQNKRLFLKFEGSLAVTIVFVNGEEVGSHEGGYSAFVFEITDHIKTGDNEIIVSVDNSPQQKLIPGIGISFSRYGGIYRPVWLLVTEKTCITPLDYAGPGIYLKQKSVTDQSAEVEVLTKISNEFKGDQTLIVKASVIDADGKIVKETSQSYEPSGEKEIESVQKITIKDPHLWNGRKDPYLYKVRVELIEKRPLNDKLLDVVEQPLGLRYFRVDPKEGFFLNGKPYDLNGVCRHQDWESIGSALKYENHKTDVDLILDIGATATRLAHYQQADDMYSLCDQSGLIVWAEIPIIPGFNGLKGDNSLQQLKELIRQNFNHPSILFWGLANEASIGFLELKILNKLAKDEDTGRLTTIASKRSAFKNRKAADLFGINGYCGWYYGTPFKIKDYLDRIQERYSGICLGLSEYGAGGCIAHQRQNPQKPDPKGNYFPEQYQSLLHEEYWSDLSQRDNLWCTFVWIMFDYGFYGIDRGDRPNMNHKGLVTWDRKTKKDAFYFYKSNWSDQPVLHVTSKRHVERTEQKTDVKVYSNCDYVTLKLNGKPLGRIENAECHNGIFKWLTVELRKGKNLIEVEGRKNGKIFKDKCVWKYD